MADITMCDGEGCPLRETCYRFKAPKSSMWQSYFAETPRHDDDCEYYWQYNPPKPNSDEQ